MLHNLRAASETWIGRIVATLLMGLIVFSFAIFGIGDFLRSVNRGGALASVGGVEIPPDVFRAAYERQLSVIGERLKRRVTNDEARAAGVDRQALDQLVNDAALDLRVKALGLAASDDLIRRKIEESPNFQGPGGKFDPERFNDGLRQLNLSANGYVVEERKTTLRQQLADAIVGDLEAPQALLEAFHRNVNETRSLEYILLPEAAAGEVAPPSDEDLAKYFAARAQNYRAPEYRSIVFLNLSPDAVAKPDAIPEADARKRYEDTKAARFTTPEKRSVQQITFPDEASAKAASERVKAGLSFDALALERQLSAQDLSLGTVKKSELLGEISKAAFELDANVVSEPIANVVGFSLIRVTQIFPAATAPFETVADAIRKELAAVGARKEWQVLHDKIEDARSAGKPLAEAAKAVGLEARAIPAVDLTGRDKQGALVRDLGADAAALLRAVFASDVGVDNDTIQTKERGAIWFEVAAIEPSRPRTLDEMKAEVSDNWRKDETARRLAAKAAELVGKLNGGAAIAEIAAAEGKLEVKSVNDAKRRGATGLPAGVVAQVFNVPVKGAGSGAAPGGRLVFVVNDSLVPAFDAESAEMKQLAPQLVSALGDDLLVQYVAQAKKDAGVTINDALLRQVVGGESAGP